MAGHGTAISTSDAQGDTDVYVVSNGGDENFTTGTFQSAKNMTGTSLAAGRTVVLEWDAGLQEIVINGTGTDATGEVSFDNGTYTVNDPGDSGLEGSVVISQEYGESGGFGGQSDIIACNIDGKAALFPNHQSE